MPDEIPLPFAVDSAARSPAGSDPESPAASAEEENRALKDQIRAIDDQFRQTRSKLRATKRKLSQAEHFRSLVHELRSRWYLRPFLSRRRLEPPKENSVDYWIYRGPRFDAPSPRRHRILVVGHLLSSTLYGSERSLLEIIAAIDRDKFEVFAVFPEVNQQVFACLRSQVEGIAVFDYSWWRQDQPCDEEAVSIFEEMCRQCAIDLVHANTIMLSDPLFAARHLGIPAVTNARELISHDADLTARLGGSAVEITQMVSANATYLLANSAATLAEYPSGERGGYIYNSIDAAAFDLPQRIVPGEIRVGLVSSNILKKGVQDFLELAWAAEEQLPALQFHLIGPETSLTTKWREEGQKLPANFHLRGPIAEPPEAYRDLNLVLNLSRFAESFGRTVAEALIARRPVIGYRHGALPELVDDGETGFLVPYLDLTAVFDRLRFFVENPAEIEKFGKRARERCLPRFAPATLAQGINSLYERLIAEARSPL